MLAKFNREKCSVSSLHVNVSSSSFPRCFHGTVLTEYLFTCYLAPLLLPFPQPLYVALKDEREEVAEFLRSAGAGAIEVPPEGFPDSDSDGEIDMAIKRMFGLTHTTDEDREGEEGSETSFPDIGDDEEEGEDAAAAGGDGDVAA